MPHKILRQKNLREMNGINLRRNRFNYLFVLFGLLTLLGTLQAQNDDHDFVSHTINPTNQEIRFFWKDDLGKSFLNFKNLKDGLDKTGDSLVFAMNGGMYNKDLSPQGLYIENGKVLTKIDTAKSGYGNFYMKPNGIFYLKSDFTPGICETESFQAYDNVLYATQSGPLLLINGEIHNKFMKGSSNVHIRNGVGILPDGNLIFAMSKNRINFYDFASYFKAKGCKYALYLDGYVSRTYLPSENWIQLDGTFGVIIGQVK